mgnify:CR=1 FL=1
MEKKFGQKFDQKFCIKKAFKSIEDQNNWFAAFDKPTVAPFLDLKLDKQAYEGVVGEYYFGNVKEGGRIDTLKLVENKKVNFIEQNEAEATYAKKIQKTETKINWNDAADKIVAKINALYPNPGSWFDLNGTRIKIIKAKEIMSKGVPGTIIDKKFTIACSKNAIQIIKLKKEGKQTMTAEEFLRGNEIKTGLTLN